MIIGIDVGGTNIDAVCVESGKILLKSKTPVDRSDIVSCIITAIKSVLNGEKPERITISTTICTNAIVEGKVEPVGMILEPGPGINPREYFDKDFMTLNSYIDHRGTEIKELNKLDIKRIKDYAKKYNYLGIVSKFSVRNPDHENFMRQLVKSDSKHITVGHEISGELNFPRRVNSVYLNSCVYKTYSEFVHAMKNAILSLNIDCPLFILKADGGTVEFDESVKIPLNTILSGPSAGVMGILASTNEACDVVAIDMGGTTTDISFYSDGVPLYEPYGTEINGYKTLVKALFSKSIGIGGDSSVKVTDDGIKVGPDRVGPAMCVGGPVPTPTDAFNVLKLTEYGETEKSLEGIQKLSQKLNMSINETAEKIYKIVIDNICSEVGRQIDLINAKPVYTIKELLHGKKIKLKKAIIVGGPSKAVAKGLGDKLGCEYLIPEHYDVINSVGAALSKVTREITLLADTEKGFAVIPELSFKKGIDRTFNIDKARKMALDKLNGEDTVITEEQIFNMVRGFNTVGKNIRIKAGIKPGITERLTF